MIPISYHLPKNLRETNVNSPYFRTLHFQDTFPKTSLKRKKTPCMSVFLRCPRKP